MQAAHSITLVPPVGFPLIRDTPILAVSTSRPPQRWHWINAAGLGARLMRWRTFSAGPGAVGGTMRSAGFGTAASYASSFERSRVALAQFFQAEPSPFVVRKALNRQITLAKQRSTGRAEDFILPRCRLPLQPGAV